MGTHRRAAALGVAGTASTTALAVWLGRSAARSWPGWGAVPLDDALGFLVLLLAAGIATWVGAILAAATVPLLGPAGVVPAVGSTGRRSGVGGTVPRWETDGPAARVTAVLLTAAALNLVPVTAQGAVDGSSGGQHLAQEQGGPSEVAVDPENSAEPEPEPVPVPGWTPTRGPAPATRPATCENGTQAALVTTTPAGAEGHPDGDDHVVVHRGDSLWSIAARQLGAHATDADVAEEWPRWYAANRAVIGNDPDHLLPGQVLVAPTGTGR